MRFAFFRPSDLGEAVHAGTASRGDREKNVKIAVCVGPILFKIGTEHILLHHAVRIEK